MSYVSGLTFTAVEETGIPRVSYVQVYPNPSSASGSVQFDLSVDEVSDLRLQIFDTLGREIYSSVTMTLPGDARLSWNSSRPVSGHFLYRVSANGNPIKSGSVIRW